MTAIPRLDPLAVRVRTGAGLHGMHLASLPLRMIEPQLDLASAGRARRTRVWELSNHLHCSIVGTCLSTAELRQVLAKTGPATDGASEHDLHRRGVMLASRRDGSAMLAVQRLVQKLGRTVALAGERYAAAVKIVLGRTVYQRAGLGQDLAQLACRQAGADDRAVELRRQLPEARPARDDSGRRCPLAVLADQDRQRCGREGNGTDQGAGGCLGA